MMKRLLLSYAAFWLLVPSVGAAKTISDHRVKSLSCRAVDADSVARAMRPEVFSSAHHLPYVNWSFQWGFYDLAGCWSLSRFQRLYFYLREPRAGLSLTQFSDQARSQEMYEDNHSWKGFPLDKFWFLPDQTEGRWPAWENGWKEAGASAPTLERGLKPDIEYYQTLRFHQIQNLKYLKGPLERMPSENDQTWSALSSLVANGRTPLILLRPARFNQHVVVAKRVEPTATGARIWVYDSNAPYRERTVTWDSATSMFTAFDIVNGLQDVTDPSAPLGVFIVDEEENELLLESLAAHYRNVCSAP